jgi:diguanylate cyclase (GGDEF)-like protein
MPRPLKARERAPPLPAPLPRQGAGELADAKLLPGVRPRIALPLHLPLTAGACVLIAHGAVALMLWRMPHWHPSTPALIAISCLVGLALSAGVLWAVGAWLGRRIDRITAVLERTQVGDYTERVDAGLHDDLGMLARRVNLLVSTSADREKRAMESALTDPLTGLPNRTLLTERIRHCLSLSQRTRDPFAVAVVDLDRFKFINDTLGHATGDTVLREVARRLRNAARDSDTVARLGGDEFVLLLSGTEEAVREVAGRIIESMKVPLHHRDQRIDIGLSIGVALYPQHGADDLSLLRHADTAMYRAKRRRSGVEVFDGELHEVRRSYLSMLGELRTALESSQFSLEYQPKLDLTSGLIVGLEGLVRWNHPTRGCVPPGEFIPFAQQTGFIHELTGWVLKEGGRFAGELAERNLDVCLSLNVSAQDLESPDFSVGIATILRTRGLDPARLCLEITEGSLVNETANALANLNAIAALGVKLSVDDFGTGYATLKQLQKLPVHELKIDRSFVSGMNQNRGNQTIVRSAIDLGKQLGVRVVAEGVETVVELRALASMGCDAIQGYYLAKPMPPADVTGWIEMRHALYADSREEYFKLLVNS